MTDEQIDRVARGFMDCSLPKAEWTHDAHFATTVWLMIKRPDLELDSVMPGLIRRYNESVGGVNDDMSGYHQTITLASLHMARQLLAGLVEGVTPAGAFTALKASPLRDRDWLLAYWSRDRLMSVAARQGWVAPDLAPLPA